jgi:hypothetical protein
MEVDSVPQEGNATLGGHRKVMYARDPTGRMVIAMSRGWEAEEIVTTHALESLQAQTAEALARVRAGTASPLAYWMCERRMDLALLAQASGYWQWRVKRHLRPEVFARLSAAQLSRYAQALGLPVSTLKTRP